MPIRYCEFEPTQHRNKRTATMVFLDDPTDKHPLAICDVCSLKLKQMRPDAILKPLREKAAKKEKPSSGQGGDPPPAAP